MILRSQKWLHYRAPRALRYAMAVALAAAGQVARIPVHPSTLIPDITCVPFIALSAAFGGLGPGMLTTVLCILESAYFAKEPLAAFRIGYPHYLIVSATLAFTGFLTSWLFDSLKRAWIANAQIARELQARQRMLESIIEYSPVAIALLEGREFRFSLVNPAYQALLPKEPMLGQTVAQVWPTATSLVIPLLNIVREAETVYHADALAVPLQPDRGKPAEERFFDVSYVPLPGTGEGDAQILVCALDVTKRRRDEIALREAYQELSAIHANAPVVLLLVDENLHLQQPNQMAAQLCGRDVSDMLGLLPGNALGCANAVTGSQVCGQGPTCGRCRVRGAILDTVATGHSHVGVEAWMTLCVDGVCQERCLVISTTALNGNQARKVLVCVQDVTERKQAESALALQHEELQRQAELINLSHDAIITTDANRVIKSWNHGAEEVYGWTEAEAIGHVMHVLLRSKGELSPKQVDEVLFRKQQWDGEVEQTRRDGRRMVLDSRQVLLRDRAENGVRILVINRDVTQRRQAEIAVARSLQRLESALAEKTVLLQEIHHRVKNNLAVTASLLGLKAESSGAEARLALEESQQRVYSIALVHEHLYGSERLDHINFGEYARELAQGVHSAFDGGMCGIGLEFELDPIEMGIERAVPCGLILNELLSNAFKYAFADGRDGRIVVSFHQPEPGWCELGVADDGVGIPAGALEGQPSSLGLRIVGILTSQLDGSLERREGPGTHIVLRFPVAA